jgi:hypothetical protein
VIRDQHSFLTGNGLLLKEERQTDVRNMTTKLSREWEYEKARLHHKVIKTAVSPPTHNSLLNNISSKRFVDVYVYTNIQVCKFINSMLSHRERKNESTCRVQSLLKAFRMV